MIYVPFRNIWNLVTGVNDGPHDLLPWLYHNSARGDLGIVLKELAF